MKAFSAWILFHSPHQIATFGVVTVLVAPQPMKEFSAF
jgi:hypothetical protein